MYSNRSAGNVDVSPSRHSIIIKDNFVLWMRFFRLRSLVWFCCLMMIQDLAAERQNHCIFVVHKHSSGPVMPTLKYPGIVIVQKIKQY